MVPLSLACLQREGCTIVFLSCISRVPSLPLECAFIFFPCSFLSLLFYFFLSINSTHSLLQPTLISTHNQPWPKLSPATTTSTSPSSPSRPSVTKVNNISLLHSSSFPSINQSLLASLTACLAFLVFSLFFPYYCFSSHNDFNTYTATIHTYIPNHHHVVSILPSTGSSTGHLVIFFFSLLLSCSFLNALPGLYGVG